MRQRRLHTLIATWSEEEKRQLWNKPIQDSPCWTTEKSEWIIICTTLYPTVSWSANRNHGNGKHSSLLSLRGYAADQNGPTHSKDLSHVEIGQGVWGNHHNCRKWKTQSHLKLSHFNVGIISLTERDIIFLLFYKPHVCVISQTCFYCFRLPLLITHFIPLQANQSVLGSPILKLEMSRDPEVPKWQLLDPVSVKATVRVTFG